MGFMLRTFWQFAVAIPVGIVAIVFMIYTFRLFRPEHVLLLACLLSDVAVLYIVLHVVVIVLPNGEKRAALLAMPRPRTVVVVGSVGVVLLIVSICLHLFSGVPLINTKDYLLVGAIPLLLVLFNRFF